MGVYVPNMEMPDDCRECEFQTFYNNCGITKCRATGKDLAINRMTIPFDGRAEWCPLVEIPEHGRLTKDKTVWIQEDISHELKAR